MNQYNQYNGGGGSPWRTLQQLLADQFGALCAEQLGQLESHEAGTVAAASWITRARQRQLQTQAARQ
jgi:hypothetical protein